MVATIAVSRARVARTISGNSPQVLTLPEGTSLDVKKGEPVYLSAGYVTAWAAGGQAILGFADADSANGVAGANNIPVVIANSDTIFEFSNADGSSAAVATAVTDVGREFGMVLDSTNRWATAARCPTYSGAPRLICLDLSNFDTVLDVGGRLLCMVIGRYRQLFCTS